MLRGDKGNSIERLYQWIDRLELKEPTFEYFAKTYGNRDLLIFAGELSEAFDMTELKKQRMNIVQARKKYLKRDELESIRKNPIWINP